MAAKGKRTQKQAKEAMDRATQAHAALNDGVLAEAFRVVDSMAMDRARRAQSPAEAYDATVTLQVLDHVLGVMRAFVADGEQAARDLDAEQEALRQRREFEQRVDGYTSAARRARAEFDQQSGGTNA